MLLSQLLYDVTEAILKYGNLEVGVENEEGVFHVGRIEPSKVFNEEIYESRDGSDLNTPVFIINIRQDSVNRSGNKK